MTEPKQMPLLVVPKKQIPRRAPRVLMHIRDAGMHHYAEWWCAKCGLEQQGHHAEEWPVKWRRPCPRCPQPWSEPDPYPFEVTMERDTFGEGER